MFTIEAPAKINWFLHVLDRRDDGYHNILTLMQCIALYDTLTFESAKAIELISPLDIPPEENLVFRAAQKLRDYAGIKNGVRIRLVKEIPTGAGFGGGSSDAAFTLRGLNTFWDLHLGDRELEHIGATLGSDVPFFFHCPLALAEGRGDVLTPFRGGFPGSVLVVKPEVSVPTPWAYKALSEERFLRDRELTESGAEEDTISLIYKASAAQDLSILKPLIRNDFEEVVIKRFAVIGELKEMLLEGGALLSLMSGSGSAVFGLFGHRAKAERAARRLSSCWTRVVNTII